MRVSHSLSGAIRRFSYWMAHGTLGYPLLEGIDYISFAKEESSFIEAAYAIFINTIEMDEDGNVLNYEYAENRAAQSIRRYFDSTYIVDPAFESWEVELHDI